MKKILMLLCSLAIFFVTIGLANATTLTSIATVDNQLRIYLSTDDTIQGVYLGDDAEMDNWVKTSTYTSNLVSGVDYYLHVYGYDYGGAAGFLGEFSLDSTDHVFANSTDHLLTNTTDWKGNFTDGTSAGWGNAYTPLDDYGPTSTWWMFGGVQGISSSATWIWAGGGDWDDPNESHVYFSTKISATQTPSVPEPATMLLFGLGLLGLAGVSRKK